MTDDNVRVQRRDDRATVTLSRPEKANALTGEMFEALESAFNSFETGEVDVVTLRGADGDFSAGVDMAGVPEWAEMKPLDVRDTLESVHAALRAIETADLPVVAALEGFVLGGGLELALACDIRIASATAEFGLPESKMGLAMDLGGAQKLPGMIGEGMTKYLVMTGDSIDATRAHEVGLVEELHEESEFDDALDRMERRLAERPTYVHGLAKRQIHSVRPSNVDEAMQQAIHHAIAAYHEEETQRRVSEFFED